MARTFLQWGADFVAGTLADQAGEAVTYKRNAGTGIESAFTFTVTAWVGQTQKVTAQPGEAANAEVAAGERDFLIRVADFPAGLTRAGFLPGGTAPRFAEPREGDWVIQTIAGVRHVFEVSPPTYGNDPAWRHSDASQTMFRVHTKLLKVERGHG